MDCVSLFSGAGGLDLGFKAAGFTTIAAVEIDRDSCRTLKANGFERVFCNDVRDWIQQNRDLRPDIVIGGPPCQPFSKSAYWSSTSAKGLADKRADCLDLFFDAVRRLRPKAFLIENVPGFLTAGGVDFVMAALRELEREGVTYQFSWNILNCADFGVPQKRQRFFGLSNRWSDSNCGESRHHCEAPSRH